MTEEIDAVMFDLGGTLIELRPSKDVVFRKVLKQHGFHVQIEKVTEAIRKAEREFDAESANLDGVNEDLFWDKFDSYVLERLGYDGDGKKFAKDVSREFEEIVPKVENWVEYPDVRPLLKDLQAKGFKLCLISNATDLARSVMDNLGLSRFFDPIVISSEVGSRKPDKRIFDIAMDGAKVAPNRSVYVGDKLEVDVVGAKKAGMNAILIDRLGIYQDVHCLRIESLRELRRFL